MKSKMKKLSGTARQFEIEMSKEMVEETFTKVIEDIRKTAKIPGFRPGNAPVDIIRKTYREDAVDELKQRLIPKAYQAALEEHKIKPISYPEIADVELEPGEIFTFKAKVDIHPEINLRKYKGLKISTQKVSVKDDEVEETLTRFRNMHAEFIEIDRPLQKGDFGICNVETLLDGEIIAKKREDMWIEADKDASMLGMGEELCGLKKGDKKDIEKVLPENYPDKKYAGKKATFRIEIKETREKKLSDINDELAKKLGKDTMDEVRQEIRTQLIERKEADTRISMKNQIMEQLLKDHSFDLPGSMVARQLKVLMEKSENELTRKGVDAGTIESHKEKLKDQLSKEAENKVKLYFILGTIADRENIDVTDEETDNWLRPLADTYKQPFEEVKKYYQEHDLIDGLKEQLREEKTLDLLLSEAVIKTRATSDEKGGTA